MCVSSDNRAVSAMFRVFGGAGRRCDAEACQHTHCRAMHQGERMFLAIWIPFSVLVAVTDCLWGWFGMAPAFLLALPAAFVAVNVLPFVMGVRSPAAQWRFWLLAGLSWAVFHLDSRMVCRAVAWGWVVLFSANLLAFVLLAIQRAFSTPGNTGVAWRALGFVALHAMALAAAWHWGWEWGLGAGALLAAVLCWAILRPTCQWLGPVTCRMPDQRILVTIDDGPDPHDTPLLLELLDRHQMKAVFFMIGEKVAAHPELAREVLRRGHEIGNHTMSHPQASFWCAGPWRTRREIAGCQRVIEEVTGTKPRLFRAPVGHRNLFTHPVAMALGLEVMAWKRRGYDAVERDVDKVLARILTDLEPGDIVLTHEATPIACEVLAGVLAKTGPGFFNR